MPVERRTIDFDPQTGVHEEYVYDHADDKIHLVQTEDTAPLLEAIQRLRNAQSSKAKHANWGKDAVTIAHLSPVMVLKLMKLGIMDRGYKIRDEAAFQVWLNEYNKFKVTEGRFA